MKEFLDRDFLLETETARHLYREYAAGQPIVDYHCHISPREIYEDRRFEDMTALWLGGRQPDGSTFGDHYKWRLMRANGVPEEYVTGSAPRKERFLKFAETLEMAVGNPMFHWCNLELKLFFGCDKPLLPETAEEIWETCNRKLREDPELTVRGILKKMNVRFVGTTDDPADDLAWHKLIREDPTMPFMVCPSFRPDKALNIRKPGFAEYMGRLAAAVGKESFSSAAEVKEALTERLEFFKEMGCRASDHGLDYIPFRPATDEEADAVFRKAMRGEAVTQEEDEQYETVMLMHLGREYARLDIAMQLHYACKRNANARMYRLMGPDIGCDMMAQTDCAGDIAKFLSALDETGECPKTVLYSRNPVDNEVLCSLIGCFQAGTMPGKIQHGSAWWFNDSRPGMEAQMRTLAAQGLLGNFIGMLTDSRAYLSYARHDYFRRIFCNLVGGLVENGEYPNTESGLRKIVEGVCYKNAARYFEIQTREE